MRYLPREDTPISNAVWQMIESAVIGAAKSQLAGRRILSVTSPHGLGLRSMDRKEEATDVTVTFADARANMDVTLTVPVPLLHSSFELPIREVASAEERGTFLNLDAAAKAAIACARMEDMLIFQGNQPRGIDGLLTAKGSTKVKLQDWSKLGQPVNDLIAAVTALDTAGFPGPYAAALAPSLHNALYRRYDEAAMTQLEHAQQIITGGLVKAPALASGGVVLSAQEYFAVILLAQDMTPAFVGPKPTSYEFVIMESLVPKITVPESICVLE